MSTSLKPGKKKITQNDLRRIMTEQKKKLSQTIKKIESPLAKYSSDGELACIVCESVVRSEAVWNVHINSKQHRENIAQIKRKKEAEARLLEPPPPSIGVKRPQPFENMIPPKKMKGILKNAPPPKVPPDFFDTTSHVSLEADMQVDNSRNSVLNDLAAESEASDEEQVEDAASEVKLEKVKGKSLCNDEVLPEGFFDDPLLDAKARNVEYKDPIEEEWEKFQKEMKEETTVSAQIIAEDQEEATAERQIDEIDEQMRNWSRVLDLEKKKEEVVQAACSRGNGGNDDEMSSADEAEFEEYLDWRAKKSYK